MSHQLNDFLKETGLDEETLEHSGVKGMRWGVRKSRRADAIQASNKRKYNGVISKKVSGIIEKHKNDKIIKKEDKKWSKNTKDTFKKTLNDPKVTAEAVKIFNKNNKNIRNIRDYENTFKVALATVASNKLKNVSNSPSGKKKLEVFLQEVDGDLEVKSRVVTIKKKKP